MLVGPDLEAWRTAQARAALARYRATLTVGEDRKPILTVSRWSVTRSFSDLAEFGRWIARVTGRMAQPRRVEPSDRLQAALQRIRLPDWPTDLAETLTDPVRAALLQADAARHEWRGRQPPVRMGAPALAVDLKRIAAGDLDEQ